jgi:methylated-DNA-[protein]-cysteine S-methyltransferase
MKSYDWMTTPLGKVLLVAGELGLEGIYFEDQHNAPVPGRAWHRDRDAFSIVRTQLTEYFAGERRSFDLPFLPRGTAFQTAVWRALCAIPFGATASYGALARELHRPAAARAVGAANAKNPLSIVVPCHRVVGAGGALTGYAGGSARKSWLLAFERNESLPGRKLSRALVVRSFGCGLVRSLR